MKPTEKKLHFPKTIVKASVIAILLSFVLCITAVPAFPSSASRQHNRPSGHQPQGLLPERLGPVKRMVRKAPRTIKQVCFFDDSTVSYVSGNSLYLSSLRPGVPELEFRGHADHIHDYKVDPNSGRIVTSSADGTLRLWDSRTGECLAVSEQLDTLDQPHWTMLQEIVFHPDGGELMTSDMNGLKIWRTCDLTLLSKEYADFFYMTSGLISPDWRTVSAPVPESYVDCAVFDRCTGDVLLYLENRYPLSYSPDGMRILAVNFESGAMEIYDVNPGNPPGRFSGVWVSSSRIPLKAATFSPDGMILASAQEGGLIRLWDTRDGTEKDGLDWEGHEIDGIRFDAEGKRLLAYSIYSGEYCIWDLED